MKKGLKIGFIIGGSIIVLGGAWAGLTKAGVIPNWFNIEILCPGDVFPNDNDYDQLDPDCSEKCYKECEKHEDEPFGYLCGNKCISTCKIPKREDCTSQCQMPDLLEEQQLYYTPSNYSNWCKEKYIEMGYSGASERIECYEIDSNLADELYYDERINEKFDGYQEELRAYESCKSLCGKNPKEVMVKKPIIYLYPTEEIEVRVELGTPENLLHTYPRYNSLKGRNVIAEPNGDLKDIGVGRKLYALYREGKTNNKTNFDEGFVVAGEDIIPFLEEKLAILGLNEREAEEFIVYWLPQMENNKYNLVRFETKEEQDRNMPLNITPKPDTLIRVMMDWKSINEPINISEQKLTTPERTGFTVVEWGGSFKN